MPCTKETVRALVSAFNVNNYFSNTVETNFALQSRSEKDHIVVSFDEGMDGYQCSRYLDGIRRKIIREFYGIEEGNDKEILDTAELIFDVKSFPFDMSKGKWSEEQGRFEFVTPVDQGVIFNLKSYLAFSLKKDVQEDMSIYITARTFDKKEYLWCGEFPDKKSRQQFESGFLSRMNERYENVPDNLLKVKGNDVYIRNVFDDARFIDSTVRYVTWLIGMHLEISSNNNHRVKLFKDMIIKSIFQSAGVIVNGFMCTSPLHVKEASILIPIIQSNEGARLLTYKEALKINCAFGSSVVYNIYDKAQAALELNGSSWVYGINFSDPQVSHRVITKIIESSVINKNHELTIDLELHFRVMSPEPSPVKEMPNGHAHEEVNDTANEGSYWRTRVSPRQSSERGAGGGTGILSQAELELHHNVNLSNRSQQSSSTAAVDVDKSVQGASGGFSASGESSGKHSKVKSEEDRAGSESPKKHEALQSEGSPSKRADELEQGASGGSRKLSFSDRAKKYASRVMERVKFKQGGGRRASIKSAPGEESISKELLASPTRSLPGTMSNPSSKKKSPVRLVSITWPLPEVTVEETSSMSGNNLKSSGEHEDKNQQLRPKASVSRNGSNRSGDSGFKSADPSPRSSFDAVALTKLEQCQENEVVEQTHL